MPKIDIVLNSTANVGGVSDMGASLAALSARIDQIDAKAKAASSSLSSFGRNFMTGIGLGSGAQVVFSVISKLREGVDHMNAMVDAGMRFNAALELSGITMAGALKQFGGAKYEDFNVALKDSAKILDMLKAKAAEIGLNFEDLAHQYQATAGAMFRGGVTDLQKQVELTVLLNRTTEALGIHSMQATRDVADILNGIANRTMLGRMLDIKDADLKAASEAGHIYEFLTEKLQGFQVAANASINTLQGLENREHATALIAQAEATKQLADGYKDLLRAQMELNDSPFYKDAIGWWAAVKGLVNATRQDIDEKLARGGLGAVFDIGLRGGRNRGRDTTTEKARDSDYNSFKASADSVRSQDDIGAAEAKGDHVSAMARFAMNQPKVSDETKAHLQGIIDKVTEEVALLEKEGDQRIKNNLAEDESNRIAMAKGESEKAIAKQSADKIHGLTKMLADEERQFDAIVHVQKKSNDEWDKNDQAASKYRAAASDAEKYRVEVEKINALRGVDGGLTNTDADAAIGRLDAARLMNSERKKSVALTQKLGDIGISVSAIESDHLMTELEKRAKLLPLYAEENALIAARLALLKKEADGSTDDKLIAQLRAEIDRLKKEQADINRKSAAPATREQSVDKSYRSSTDPSAHFSSASGGAIGGIKEMAMQIGTMGDMVEKSFVRAASGIQSAMGTAFSNMLMHGGSFYSKLIGMWNGMVGAIANSVAKMAADWVFKHTIMAAFSRAFHVQDVGLAVSGEATKTSVTAAGTAARIMMGIKEGMVWLWQAGVKAMTAVASIPYVGPFLAIAALAAVVGLGMAAMKGFENGGIIDGGEQIIRVNEGGTEAVLNARATSMLGHSAINSLNAGRMFTPNVAASLTQPAYGQSGGGEGGSGSGGGSGGKGTQVAYVDARDHNALEQLKRDPAFTTHVLHIMQNNRRQLGVNT